MQVWRLLNDTFENMYHDDGNRFLTCTRFLEFNACGLKQGYTKKRHLEERFAVHRTTRTRGKANDAHDVWYARQPHVQPRAISKRIPFRGHTA